MTVYYSAHARSTAPRPAAPAFRMLFVCVGNQCRSPMGERIARTELRRRLGLGSQSWLVTSAGTKAPEGDPMHRYAALTLSGLGVDAEGFSSRRLTPRAALEADAILAATAAERDAVIARVPPTLATAFTLRELARLVSAVPGAAPGGPADPLESARRMVAEARRMRGRVPYVEPERDDVLDPPRTPAAFEQCAAQIAEAVRTILDRLVSPAVPADARC